MADKDFSLASGARLHVTTAPFGDANALVKALAACAKGTPLAADPTSMDLSILKDVVVDAITSPVVEQALFKCLERCSYDDVKLVPANFDIEQIKDKFRGDYYEVCWKVVEANCAPFFVNAFSMLKDRMASGTASQK